MTYQHAVEKLLELGHELHATPSNKFDLAYVRVMLDALSHPERRFAAVLIAGTNGKGSTAATLESILRAAGHRTALYTSPHLVRVNERIQVDGEEITDAEFAVVYDRVEAVVQDLLAKDTLPWHPSFFEMLTVMAFEYFAMSGVQIAVLEVGMGGRLDATNVVEPIVAVITDVALDHQRFLGDTITQIAREKAGIIRPGGIVVTLPQHPQANDVIGNTILDRGATAITAVPYVPPVSPGADLNGRGVSNLKGHGSSDLKGHGFSRANTGQKDGGALAPEGPDPSRNVERETRNVYPLMVQGQQILVDSPLLGRHQLRNIALAIAAAEQVNNFGFRVIAQDIERGIRDTRWRGRFQRLAPHDAWPEIILDVAHNPAGAWALRSTLSECVGERPLTFVFGAMRDKAIAEIAEILFPLAAHVIATHAHNPRAATPDEIRHAAARAAADIEPADSVPAALDRARDLAGSHGLIVVTGSIYIVGEALAVLSRQLAARQV
ncbi:MAG: bifunctional folylpolyglutamate synthase/dihydrofolate synthase [Acidobacteriia bacterium]|nr:bifunctional folylpolyglutamate synthase/dihydrofolate synthase [Terriglobia bacterium]